MDIRPKRLNLIRGRLPAESQGLLFHCNDENKEIICNITDAAFRDLIDFHRLNRSKTELAQAIVTEIERLANAKYNAARIEETGMLVIRLADLILYGFQARNDSAA